MNMYKTQNLTYIWMYFESKSQIDVSQNKGHYANLFLTYSSI